MITLHVKITFEYLVIGLLQTMPKKTNTARDRECTEECQSVQHASELISAITFPGTGISDKQLASYFKSKCSNFPKVSERRGHRGRGNFLRFNPDLPDISM